MREVFAAVPPLIRLPRALAFYAEPELEVVRYSNILDPRRHSGWAPTLGNVD